MCFHITFGGDQHRRSNRFNVGAGKATVDADSVNVIAQLPLPGSLKPRNHRADVGTCTVNFFQHGSPYAQGLRFYFAIHRGLQQISSAPSGDPHIDMRIGLVRNDYIGQLTHLFTDIGVQIECYRNRNVRATKRSQARQYFALTVIVVIRNHRTMQSQNDAVIILFV